MISAIRFEIGPVPKAVELHRISTILVPKGTGPTTKEIIDANPDKQFKNCPHIWVADPSIINPKINQIPSSLIQDSDHQDDGLWTENKITSIP